MIRRIKKISISNRAGVAIGPNMQQEFILKVREGETITLD